MKKPIQYLGAGLYIFFSFGATAEAAVKPHPNCIDCHTRGKALKAASLDELCLSCHPDNIKDHMLGVAPKTPPAGLPLGRDRKMTCATCHEPHGKGTVDKLLRMDKTSLCAACHQR